MTTTTTQTAPGEPLAEYFGGTMPAKRLGTVALAHLLNHIPLETIDGKYLGMLVGVRSRDLKTAIRSSKRVRKAFTGRGWRIEKRPTGKEGRRVNWLIREEEDSNQDEQQ